jgi:hypothetical protein
VFEPLELIIATKSEKDVPKELTPITDALGPNHTQSIGGGGICTYLVQAYDL